MAFATAPHFGSLVVEPRAPTRVQRDVVTVHPASSSSSRPAERGGPGLGQPRAASGLAAAVGVAALLGAGLRGRRARRAARVALERLPYAAGLGRPTGVICRASADDSPGLPPGVKPGGNRAAKIRQVRDALRQLKAKKEGDSTGDEMDSGSNNPPADPSQKRDAQEASRAAAERAAQRTREDQARRGGSVRERRRQRKGKAAAPEEPEEFSAGVSQFRRQGEAAAEPEGARGSRGGEPVEAEVVGAPDGEREEEDEHEEEDDDMPEWDEEWGEPGQGRRLPREFALDGMDEGELDFEGQYQAAAPQPTGKGISAADVLNAQWGNWYDDMQVVEDEMEEEEGAPKPQDFSESPQGQAAPRDVESRKWVVSAEGIAVRVAPDHQSEQTGEIMRQGQEFVSIQAVDGKGNDLRTYLKLPDRRGWVFDDSKIFPTLPSCRIVDDHAPGEKYRGGRDIEREGIVKRPTIAVIGRPNVGKSTLVNCLAALRQQFGQIVFDEEGVTRDLAYKPSKHVGANGDMYVFDIVDTGGLIFADEDSKTWAEEIRLQIDVALQEASACIFVVDSQVGLLNEDKKIAQYLRKTWVKYKDLQVQVVVAKCDRLETMDIRAVDFWELNFGNPHPVSALYNRGVWEMMEDLLQKAKPGTFVPIPRETAAHYNDLELEFRGPRVDVCCTLVGRANAGKSTMLNKLTGEYRALVSDVPGTTTDSVDALVRVASGRTYRFVDTAGIRRPKRIEPGEKDFLMVNRSFKAMKRADIVLFLIDASEIMRENNMLGDAYWVPKTTDRYIANKIEESGAGCVVVLTKWDAIPKKDVDTTDQYVQVVRNKLLSIGQWAEIVTVSALTGQRMTRVFEAIEKTLTAHRRRIRTPVLNEVIRDALLWKLPSADRKRRKGRIYYATQVSTEPPTIVIFCNDPLAFRSQWKAYMENKLRQDLNWFGVPLQIFWRRRRERQAVSQAERWLEPRLQNEEIWR